MPEVKRRELQVRSKDTFTAIQWFKHGDHEKVTHVPRGTSSYSIPAKHRCNRNRLAQRSQQSRVGQSVSSFEWIIGPMEGDDGQGLLRSPNRETFRELYEEVPATEPEPAPVAEPVVQQKKGTGMRR